MPPRKNKKKDQDQYLDHIEECSKWANAMAGSNSSDSDREELNGRKREPFTYDFSHVKELYEMGNNIPQPQMTDQQKQIIKERNEKIQLAREKKHNAKLEKLKERQLIAQADKKIQEQNREKNQRINQKAHHKLKEINTKCNSIPLVLLIMLVLLGLLQYQRQIYLKLSHLRLSPNKDLYSVLETDSGATDAELKAKYRKLLLKYHPDRGCLSCTARFQQIVQAYQILGDEEKRRSYDESSGFVSPIKSNSVTLSPFNIYNLLTPHSLWLVQVYDSTQQYSHYFGEMWDDAMEAYSPMLQFARVDSWHQSHMMSYLPYRFQLFPAVYLHHRGRDILCDIDFNRVRRSLDLCIQTNIPPTPITKIHSVAEAPPSTHGKKNVFVGKGINLYDKTNILHQKYQQYFNYYKVLHLADQVVVEGSKEFTFTKHKNIYKQYETYLQSQIVQKTNPCVVQLSCESDPCIILFEDTPSPLNHTFNYPVYKIQTKEFQRNIKDFFDKQSVSEKFDLMVYRNGEIWLGYVDQANNLIDSEEGQLFQLKCQQQTIVDWLFDTIEEIKGYL